MGDVPRVWSLFNVCGRNFQTGPCHGAPKAGAAIHTGIESVGVDARVADEGDPAVAQLNEMPRSQVATSNIVNVGMRKSWVPKVHDDNRHPGGQQSLQLSLRWWHRDDQYAVWPTVDHVPELFVHLLWPPNVVEHDVVAACREPLFRSAQEEYSGWVGEEGCQHANCHRASARQPTSNLAWAVVQSLDSLLYSPPGGIANWRGAVDDPGKCCLSHSGGRRDFRDVGQSMLALPGNRFHTRIVPSLTARRACGTVCLKPVSWTTGTRAQV